MTNPSLCPTCGKPLPPNAPRGLCPECLMEVGLAATETNGPDSAPAAASPSVGEIAGLFPQLEVLELLGRGGMGVVYKARQPQLDRPVALKILLRRHSDGGRDNAFAERFAREARALARLNHPNIVAVYDYGQAGGYAFLLMEYVDGLSLRQLLQRGNLPPEEALGILPQVCAALQFAHQQGVIHRDIKPENILLDKQGRVKIGDFGIAKMAGPAQPAGLTSAQQVIGTPHYMAPEQVENPQTVDHRADIYSLGVVFYEMLTGELPLGKFAPPSHKSWADARLDEVVLHALEKEPSMRYQQAGEVKTAVETIAATPNAAMPPIPAVRTPVEKSKRGKRIAWVFGLGLGAVSIFFLCIGGLGAAKHLICAFFQKGSAPSLSDASVNSNRFDHLLNDNQRLVLQHMNRQFEAYFDERTYDSPPPQDRDVPESRSLETSNGPRTRKGPSSYEPYRAINSPAALHSTNVLPLLRKLAFVHKDTIVRLESSNRRCWMAIRALGIVGDKTVVPEMIHALYHNNSYVRWSAQISLVRLTGQNFGNDWQAWGSWWNAQHGQPPFNPEIVHWWRGQAEPHKLAKELAEDDQKFLETIIQGKRYKASFPASSENSPSE